MKNTLIIIIVLAVFGGAVYLLMRNSAAPAPVVEDEQRVGDQPTVPNDDGGQGSSIVTDTFAGTLTEVNTACFADGECYIVVDGKHVTLQWGFRQEVVGTLQGVESIGDLEAHIGDQVEVYAQENRDMTYTLYGSAGFYVQVY